MRLNFRVKIGSVTYFTMLSTTQTLEGIASLQKDGSHIPMWDMEKCTLEQAEETLRNVQDKYRLSDILIFSDKEGSYRAICFSKVDFRTFMRILLETEYVDWNFIYWTMKRGKATLRTSNKKGRPAQKPVSILYSFPAQIPRMMEQVVYDTGVEKRGHVILLGGRHG